MPHGFHANPINISKSLRSALNILCMKTAPLPGEKDNTGDPAGESSRTTQCPTHVQRAREQHARRAFGLDEQVEQSPLTGKTFQTDSLTTQQTRKLTAKPGRRRSYTYSVV